MNYFKNNQINQQRGFTLVEVLVVISIIAVMATFAVVRLGPVRLKAKDSTIKVDLGTLRSVAEINFDDKNDYAWICTALSSTSTTLTPPDLDVFDLGVKIKKEIISSSSALTCKGNASTYFVAAPLLSNTKFFCIDASGFAGEITAVPTNTIAPFACK
ncbi:prepilin-type N-terminal cleavage/methylation domain-containing protein [Candidatus Azambacteria bacterium]|nr:prepilin-type N-terminal cleavage/methylation domain-containing protein [Candidatus Azambacteria bacterium]